MRGTLRGNEGASSLRGSLVAMDTAQTHALAKPLHDHSMVISFNIYISGDDKKTEAQCHGDTHVLVGCSLTSSDIISDGLKIEANKCIAQAAGIGVVQVRCIYFAVFFLIFCSLLKKIELQ